MIAAALFILACATSAASTRIPVQIPASIVLLPVSVNDGPPVTFILAFFRVVASRHVPYRAVS